MNKLSLSHAEKIIYENFKYNSQSRVDSFNGKKCYLNKNESCITSFESKCSIEKNNNLIHSLKHKPRNQQRRHLWNVEHTPRMEPNYNSIVINNKTTGTKSGESPKLVNLISIVHNIELCKQLKSFWDFRSLCWLSSSSKYLNYTLKQYIFEVFLQMIYTNSNHSFRDKIKRSWFKHSTPALNNTNSNDDPTLFFQSIYSDYFYKDGDREYDEEIHRDLLRTFPTNPSFMQGTNNHNRWKRLLITYSKYKKSIGYAQGLNFWYGNAILLFDNEEEVFFFVDGWINKFDFEKLYGITNSLRKTMNKIERIWEAYTPWIVKFLAKNYWNHEFFVSNWWLTLFSNSMDIELVFVVWDFMIVFGWRFFYCFIVQVLLRYQKEILSEDASNLSVYMKNWWKTERFNTEFELVLKDCFEMWRGVFFCDD